MDPFTEKELIDNLKAINLNLIEMNVKLEGIEKAIRESSFVDSDEEDFGEAVVEDEEEGINPENKFSIVKENLVDSESFEEADEDEGQNF